MKSLELPQLSMGEIQVETQFVRVWENGLGIQYDIIRGPNHTFERIQFVNRLSEGVKLEVLINTGKDWPVPREYTLEEAVKFMQVAVAAQPDAPMTLLLCEHIESLGEQLQKGAAEKIQVLRVRKAKQQSI